MDDLINLSKIVILDCDGVVRLSGELTSRRTGLAPWTQAQLATRTGQLHQDDSEIPELA